MPRLAMYMSSTNGIRTKYICFVLLAMIDEGHVLCTVHVEYKWLI